MEEFLEGSFSSPWKTLHEFRFLAKSIVPVSRKGSLKRSYAFTADCDSEKKVTSANFERLAAGLS